MPPSSQGFLWIGLVLGAVFAWLVVQPDPQFAPDEPAGAVFPPTAAVSRKSEPAAKHVDRQVIPVSADLPQVEHAHAAGCDESCELNHGTKETGASLPLPDDFLEQILADKSTVRIGLPGGGTASGRVSSIRRDESGVLLMHGTVSEPQPGKFVFQRQTAPGKAGPLIGSIHFNESKTAYQVRPTGGNGRPELVETTVDKVICRGFVRPEEPGGVADEIPATHPQDYPIPPDENGIIQLQSLPGASAVVYLDFDGETRDFATWGYIDALPSGASNSEIFEVWKGVSEDFQPFQINITTVRSVYEAAAPGQRMQVVITPTKDASPDAGGVAWTGSFNWTSETVCWSFYSTGKNAVEVISHEVGHTLGLSHDGRSWPWQEYYAGHNGWATIMGVGYYKSLSQWSKGEYPYANNSEDDLYIIATNNNEVSYRPDDHGASLGAAGWLNVSSGGGASGEGVIETRSDEDSFRFTTTGGAVALDVDPVSFNANLNVKVELFDSSNVLIAADDPGGSIDAKIAGVTLAAGDYFLRISGVGNGDLSTGYSDYASLGSYTITGSILGGVPDENLTVAENSAAGTVLGSIPARVDHGAGVLSFAISSGNTGGTFDIDSGTGSISVADGALLDYESLSTRWDDPPTLELFVSVTDSLGVAVETIRTVVTVTDVNEAPEFPAIAALTVPENLVPGTALVAVEATDVDHYDYLTYEITDGNTDGTFAIDANTGWISVAGPLDSDDNATYVLSVRATDQGDPALMADTELVINILGLSSGVIPGSIIQTFYNGISGSSVSNLTGHPNYPERPHSEVLLTSFESGKNLGSSYGSAVRGYVIAPATGDYTFWISANDSGELWISPDAEPGNAVLRASVTSRTNPNEWTKYPSQRSALIPMTAGQVYYIEALQKESFVDDHVQVAWQGPAMTGPELVPGQWLAPFVKDYAPWSEDGVLALREAASEGMAFGKPSFVEADLGQSIVSYQITAGNDAEIFSIDPASGDISVADGGSLVAGQSHVLTISASDSGNPPMSGQMDMTIQVSGLDTGLHTWWKLDEASGSYVNDSSGNNRHAYLYGGGSWVIRADANDMLQLNGTDAYCGYFGGGGLSADSSFSVAMWVKVPSGHSSEAVLIQQRASGYGGFIGQYRVKLLAAGNVEFSIYGNDENGGNEGNQFVISSPEAINDDIWHHVACVRDGTQGRIFVDGVERAAGSGPVRYLNSEFTVAVGCDVRYNNSFLNGAVDDVRIYSEALNGLQIARVAGAPKVSIISPKTDCAEIRAGVGLMLQSASSDPDGVTPAVSWSQVDGPALAVFGTPGMAGTTASFPVPGSYRLRATASDGVNSSVDDVFVLVASTASSAFGGFTYGAGTTGTYYSQNSSSYTLEQSSGGIRANRTSDGFYLLGQAFDGDFDFRTRVTAVDDEPGSSTGSGGLIVRAGTAGGGGEVSGYIGFNGSSGFLITRVAPGGSNIQTTYSSMALPRWCRMRRSGNMVEFLHSNDGSTWLSRGTMSFSGTVRAGLCCGSTSFDFPGMAVFDNVSGFSNSNVGPMVNAGSGAAASAGVPVDLACSVDDDGLPADPGFISTTWSRVSGPGGVTFADPGHVFTSATCAVEGSHVLRLVADDGELRTYDETALEVTNPVLYLDANGASPGSGAPATVEWDAAPIWSTQADGDGLTYPWVDAAHAVLAAGNDGGASTITVSGSHLIGGLTVEEGSPFLTGGGLSLAAVATPFQIAGSLEIASGVSGTGMGILKSGGGILTLSGISPFSGPVAVAAGELVVSGELTACDSLNVLSDGRLSGDGVVANDVIISGTLAAGGGVGILTTGALTLEDGARVEWEAGDWEGVAGTGFDQTDAASLDFPAGAVITVVLSAESLVNFTESPASFILVRTVSGVTGFEVGNVMIDDSGFPGATGDWSVETIGNDLVLRYDPLAPFEAWQLSEFGEEAENTLTAGEAADPDSDGLKNLLEFALGTNPRLPDVASMSHDVEDVSGTGHLRLSIDRNPAAKDVVFIVECTDDLADSGSWSAAETIIEVDTPARLVVRDALGGPRRFMRLRVTK